ncbi:hypothetical protein [Bradyrhizobium sp. HKCCYLRH1062]|uniref:hypothetical protein n=1 Tax=unclassified Bradyrhizobium TaxID=2631580 RepID=UPI003EBFC947
MIVSIRHSKIALAPSGEAAEADLREGARGNAQIEEAVKLLGFFRAPNERPVGSQAQPEYGPDI